MSCGTYSDSDIQYFDDQIQEIITKNNWTMQRTDSGLYFEIIDAGTNSDHIRFTDQVIFYYIGKLSDSSTFQIIDKDDPLSFRVSELIVGWQEALSLISEGGTIRIILPPQLGYGSKDTGLISANSILIYELTVLEVI